MGSTQSCSKGESTQPQELVNPVSSLYNLHFMCATLPVIESEKPIEKILYAEEWCLNESVWRTYIQNAFREIDPSKRARVNRLRIFTKVHGDIIIGNVKWVSSDIDIDALNENIRTNDENMFEKGLYFIEPYWSTCIVPHYVSKSRMVSVD